MVMSKKGATEPVLIVGYLIIIVLTGVFMLTVYDKISDMAVVAQASTTSKDLGSMIEVTYAAPGDIFIDYETPTDTQGFPAIGSILLNGDSGVLKTHPLTEDEMWMEISNNALTAWGVGIATKSAYETKKMYNNYAARRARAEVGRMVFETNPGEYSDLLYKGGTMSSDSQKAFKNVLNSRGTGTSALKNRILHGSGPGGSLKAVLSDGQSVEVMNQLGKNQKFMEIVQAKPEVMKNIGKAAEADLIQRKFILAETSWPSGSEGYKFFTENPEGIKLMNALSQDPSVTDFLKTSAELENSKDATNVLKTFGDSKFYSSALKVTEKVEGSGLVKLLATKEGEDALSLFRGGEISGIASPISPTEILKKRSPIGRRQAIVTQRNIGKEMRSIASDKASADAFLELSKSKEATEFRHFLMETGARDYNKLLKQVKATESASEAGRLIELRTNAKVEKIMKKYGLTYDSLKSMVKLNEVSPKLAESLGKSGGWRARVTLGNTKSTEAIENLLTFSSKSEDIAKAAKSKSLYSKLSVSTLLKGGVRKVTSAANRAVSFIVSKTVGKVSQRATKEATGNFLTATGKELGKGVKIGMGNAGTATAVLTPLGQCEASPCGFALGLDCIKNAACRVTAWGIWAVMIGVDIISVTYPTVMMIYMGRETSQEVKSRESNFQYLGDASTIYADPANCGSESKGNVFESLGKDYADKGSNFIDNLKDPELSFDYAWEVIKTIVLLPLDFISPLFGAIGQAFPGTSCTIDGKQTQVEVDSVQHHTQLENCMDEGGYCPNYYVSSNKFGTFGDWELAGINLGVDVDSLATKGAYAWAAGTSACAALGWGIPWAGAICYFGYYASLAVAFSVAPDTVIPIFTGSNIYPQEDYWYAQSPTMVQIYREYNEDTKEQELSIYAA